MADMGHHFEYATSQPSTQEAPWIHSSLAHERSGRQAHAGFPGVAGSQLPKKYPRRTGVA